MRTLDAIVDLQPNHRVQLESLLRAYGLPSEDCAAEGCSFVGIFDAPGLIAAGGLEAAGNAALLRSVVVDKDWRGAGLAAAITRELITRAGRQGYAALYLLTESAAEYFAGFGFEAVPRTDLPASIVQTRQFSSLCPQSACCMRLMLATD